MSAVREWVSCRPVRAMLIGVTLLALVARVAWVAVDANYSPILDAESYFLQGIYLYNRHHLLRLEPPVTAFGYHSRRWPSAYWPPLYTMFQASGQELHHWLQFTGLTAITIIRVVQAVIGAIGVGLMALIALRLFGRRVSTVTGIFAALFPPSIFVCESFYSESLWVPLFIAAVAAAVEYRRTRRLWWVVVAGLLTGLGTLTHSNGVYLLPPVIVAIWPRGGLRLRTSGGQHQRSFTPRGFLPLTAYLAVVVVTLTPWTVRNWVQLHHFIPISTSFGNTVAGVYNDQSRLSKKNPGAWVLVRNVRLYDSINEEDDGNPNPATADDQLTARAFHYIEQHPTYPFVVAYWNTARLLQITGPGLSEWYSREVGVDSRWSDVAMLSFWLIALAALYGCFTQRVRLGEKWIWLVPLVMYLGIVFIQSEVPRFRSPIDPFLCMLAACAVVSVWERREQHRLPRRRPGFRGEYANT
jgi:branched-subunit amino acid transport protein